MVAIAGACEGEAVRRAARPDDAPRRRSRFEMPVARAPGRSFWLDASLNVGGPGGTAGDGRLRGVSQAPEAPVDGGVLAHAPVPFWPKPVASARFFGRRSRRGGRGHHNGTRG